MSDMLSAIHDDIDTYVSLCKKYGVKPKCDSHGVDPYCKHADELNKRARKEWEIKNKGVIVPENEQKLPDLS